tara:strand:- start:50 stop:436 length:387 start_codon:yes stop_codon:yes gene_type:complete
MSISINSLASVHRAVKRQNNRGFVFGAARDASAELGYGCSTVDDIIRRVALALGTFNNYFNREEVAFKALSDEIASESLQLLGDVRQRATSFRGFIEANFFIYFPGMRTIGKIIFRRAQTVAVLAGAT